MSELKHMHAKTECLPFNTEDVRLIITERYGKQEIRMHGEDAIFIVEAIAAAKRRTQPEATKPAQDLGAVIATRPLTEIDADIATGGGLGRMDRLLKERAAALASPSDALVAGDRVDAERTGTLYQAVQRAAGELPEGWTICLEIERDAGTVELIDPEGNRKLIDGNDGYLCQAVNEATNAAIQAQKDGHG